MCTSEEYNPKRCNSCEYRPDGYEIDDFLDELMYQASKAIDDDSWLCKDCRC